MESSWWILILLLALSLPLLLKLALSSLQAKATKNLPPGPRYIPIITPLGWLSKNLLDLGPILRKLRAKYGPIITIRFISRPSIIIADRHLAHRALVESGSDFADRRPATQSTRILSSNGHNISSCAYGPLWRLLRRNLASNVLHPSRVKQFTGARKWVLRILLDELKLRAEESDRGVVVVMESLRFAMFSLLVLMCFGEKLEVEKIREIEATQNSLQALLVKLAVFSFLPRITKILFRKRWETLLGIRGKQEEMYVPLIRAREKSVDKGSYVDSLVELSIPGEVGGERRLTEGEIVSLCSEFLSAGTDTTATALEWIMAELVKNQDVQKKLREELLPPDQEGEVKEEDLQKMPYLRAVVLEGLRRHPPAHFVLPHAVTEEVSFGGYVVPKEASVHFAVAELGWDEKVWTEPMEFRPERFLVGGEGEGVDLTGSREIKMMPFGAGRRICPGLGLAVLHLEYFVANLVREFRWEGVHGEEVDLTEKMELTVMMKNHLQARISPQR